MKITQFARISHHTLSGFTNSTFTIPSTNDFTDGTWTIYDLAQSEFGVNETSKRAFLRTGSEIKELTLTSFVTASTSGTNSATMSEFYLPSTEIKGFKINVKGQADGSNYESIVSDIFFGLRNWGTSSLAFTAGTYSMTTYKDFSAVGIGPVLTITGLTCSLSVAGAAGYTISWSANIQTF